MLFNHKIFWFPPLSDNFGTNWPCDEPENKVCQTGNAKCQRRFGKPLCFCNSSQYVYHGDVCKDKCALVPGQFCPNGACYNGRCFDDIVSLGMYVKHTCSK